MADTSSGGANVPNIPRIPGDGEWTSPGDLYTLVSQNATTVMPRAINSSCDTIDFSYNIPTAVICAMCFIFGIVYTFFGKYFKV